MENELIKYWTKKSVFYVSILWLIVQIIFIIIGSILINTTSEKIINILLIVGINSLILLILFAFSINHYTYETVYQIKVKGSTFQTKFYRYLIILFSFGWLIFFILNALFMLVETAVFKSKLDYFNTLNDHWWILLIVTIFNVLIISIHRQLMHYTLTNLQLPWSKYINNKK